SGGRFESRLVATEFRVGPRDCGQGDHTEWATVHRDRGHAGRVSRDVADRHSAGTLGAVDAAATSDGGGLLRRSQPGIGERVRTIETRSQPDTSPGGSQSNEQAAGENLS